MEPLDDDYEAITHGIRVRVHPVFLDEESDSDQFRFVWAYRVQISNESDDSVQLINRYWQITDGRGRVQEVHGPGVVGEQPVLDPGDVYEYTSGCPLETPSGVMQGHYEMERSDGSAFNAAIPPFSLDCPHQRATVN